MAKIVPFRGLRYNLSKIPTSASVTAPPYDVISPSLQEELYRRSPYNVVRLILGLAEPGATETSNRYTRAAAELQRWQQEEVLVRDSEPAIYLYDQTYSVDDGKTLVRRGFIALTRLEDFATGVVKPHEKTLAAPKLDRLNLLLACRTNLSPVFSLYADPCCVLEALTRRERERLPEVETVDDDGVEHRLWRITDAAIIRRAQELLANKPLFLADGHHRYEAAVAFRNRMRELHPNYTGKETFNYLLMYFANMEDQGVFIQPTHRLVGNLPDFRIESFLRALDPWCSVDTEQFDPVSSDGRREVRQKLHQRGSVRRTLALFAGDALIHYLSLRDEKTMDRFFDGKTPKALRTLDVSILHQLILERLLGIGSEAQEQQLHLKYVRNYDEPFDRVLSGEFQAAFLMNATRLSEVRDVANAGEKMPQKSTYFYPKLLSGLVFSPIIEGEKAAD